MVDSTPIVLRDVNAWLAQEAAVLLARRDLPAGLFERIAQGAGGALARDQQLLSVYTASQEGPLQRWSAERVLSMTGRALDMGCGASFHGGAHPGLELVGMDLNWTMLARFPGARLLADAHDPPFLAESFDHVLLLNLLDSCREPYLVLQQADALLAPGGTLLISCAFAWQDSVTPRENRFDERFLLEFLSVRGYRHQGDSPLELDWPLHLGARTRHIHRTLALCAQKPARGAPAATD